MTRDDINTFEARLEDKTLFQNIALVLLSAAIPLGIEKFVDYSGAGKPTDLAIVILCGGAALLGAVAQAIAFKRRAKTESFKDSLFMHDRLVSSTIRMVDTGATQVNIRTVS